MSDSIEPLDQLIYELKERAKELNCLYEVQELLSEPEKTIDEITLLFSERAIVRLWSFIGVINAYPPYKFVLYDYVCTLYPSCFYKIW